MAPRMHDLCEAERWQQQLTCVLLLISADGRIRSQALDQRLQARLDSITQVLWGLSNDFHYPARNSRHAVAAWRDVTCWRAAE
jgi:hypothetical protein